MTSRFSLNERTTLHTDRHATVNYQDFSDNKTGRKGTYIVAATGNGQGVAAIPFFVHNNETHVILMREYRVPHGGTWQLGFPRGGTEDTDADFEISAIREVTEETGLEVLSAKRLGKFNPDNGILSVIVNAYAVLVEPPQFTHGVPFFVEEETGSEAIAVTLSHFKELARNGTIECGLTLSAYGLAAIRGIL